MKILMVAIPNHHFFQWVNQLKDSGFEVYWFDVSDTPEKVAKIDWVTQIKGWKLKWDFPFRYTLKSWFPRIYHWIHQFNKNKLSVVFDQKIKEIQPDVVHCFEMHVTGLKIMTVLQKHPNLKVIYSSWGSDIFNYERNGATHEQVHAFLNRVDYLITDCQRDFKIATDSGFKNHFLGVFPGNGGIPYIQKAILDTHLRDTLLIKGYHNIDGRALQVIQALEHVPISLLQNTCLVIFSAETVVAEYVKESSFFADLNVSIYLRSEFVSNATLLTIMGKSKLYIGNNVSDGMPNSLLEAMGMGAFPIQSNPGGVTEEVIENGKNGLLIADPLDVSEITTHIVNALQNSELRQNAQEFNTSFAHNKYNQASLQPKIVSLYQQVHQQ